MFAQMSLTAKYTSSSVKVSGDMAVDTYAATLTITPKGGVAMTDQIKGIHVLRKGADGTWKIAQDTWNSDAPAAAAPPPSAKP
jgi:ketosteroid isomerase-like protein